MKRGEYVLIIIKPVLGIKSPDKNQWTVVQRVKSRSSRLVPAQGFASSAQASAIALSHEIRTPCPQLRSELRRGKNQLLDSACVQYMFS